MLTRPHTEEVLLLADSRLALNTTDGTWSARKNKALVASSKAALNALRRRGVVVRLQHVRAHEGHAMNERADRLAKRGAQGLRERDGRFYDPPGPPTLPSFHPPLTSPTLPPRHGAGLVPQGTTRGLAILPLVVVRVPRSLPYLTSLLTPIACVKPFINAKPRDGRTNAGRDTRTAMALKAPGQMP